MSSAPRPRSISKLYSQVDDGWLGVILVSDGVTGVRLVNCGVRLAVVVTEDDDCEERLELDDVNEVIVVVSTFVLVFVSVFVLINGSSADCDDRLSTLLQLMGFSSSP